MRGREEVHTTLEAVGAVRGVVGDGGVGNVASRFGQDVGVGAVMTDSGLGRGVGDGGVAGIVGVVDAPVREVVGFGDAVAVGAEENRVPEGRIGVAEVAQREARGGFRVGVEAGVGVGDGIRVGVGAVVGGVGVGGVGVGGVGIVGVGISVGF